MSNINWEKGALKKDLGSMTNAQFREKYSEQYPAIKPHGYLKAIRDIHSIPEPNSHKGRGVTIAPEIVSAILADIKAGKPIADIDTVCRAKTGRSVLAFVKYGLRNSLKEVRTAFAEAI